MIDPYDRTLNSLGRADRRSWADQVLGQLDNKFGVMDELTFEIHAGANYCDCDFGLVDGLAFRGAGAARPAQGLAQGQQLAFYKAAR